MNWLEICDRFATPAERVTALAREIVPDFAGAPFYTIWAEDVRPLIATRCVSFFTPLSDIVFRPYLESIGAWRGRGPAIVIDTDAPSFVAIALHELTHACEAIRKPGADNLPPIEPATLARVERALYATAEQPVAVPRHDDKEPWYHHGLTFIRYAVHVRHRAARLGLTIPLQAMQVAGRRYGLSPAADYERELAAELINFDEERRFVELRDVEPPRGFIELFEHDQAAWNEQRVAAGSAA